MIQQGGGLLLVYTAFVLEATGVGGDAARVEPRWLLLAAAWINWTMRPGPAVLWGGLCGLLFSVVAGGDPGIWVAGVALAGWCLGWLRRERRWSSGVACVLSVFAMTASCLAGVDLLVRLLSGAHQPEPRQWGLQICAQGALTALWGAALWLMQRSLSAMARRLSPPLHWRTAGE
jgi:cell shape-determining protein MreD